MKRRRKRKCLHCQALFHPDPRNVRHQKYCSETECRKVSKAASQRRWLNKEANKDYFCGPENVGRVQTYTALESKLYGWGEEVSSNTIQVHIHNLRKRLPPQFITTIRGVGYVIKDVF
jgi:hypothetical protein